MKIAVTGHTGFIGKKVFAKLVEAGYDVIGLSRSNGFDLNDPLSLDVVASFDVLIHLAANTYIPDSFEKPSQFFRDNINGTINVLEACRNHQAKIIFISSFVYGHPEYLPIDEKHPVRPANPYTWSKSIGENLCQSYHENFGIDTCVIRPFNVYGPGQKGKFLIPLILDQLSSGVIKLQDDRPRRDFIHVDDLANAILACVNNKEKETLFNIGSGESVGIADITDWLIEAGLIDIDKVSFSKEKRANEVLETKANIEHAKDRLGWQPQKNFKEEFLQMAKQAVKNA